MTRPLAKSKAIRFIAYLYVETVSNSLYFCVFEIIFISFFYNEMDTQQYEKRSYIHAM